MRAGLVTKHLNAKGGKVWGHQNFAVWHPPTRIAYMGKLFLFKEEDKAVFDSLWRAAVQWQPHSEKGPGFFKITSLCASNSPWPQSS